MGTETETTGRKEPEIKTDGARARAHTHSKEERRESLIERLGDAR